MSNMSYWILSIFVCAMGSYSFLIDEISSFQYWVLILLANVVILLAEIKTNTERREKS